MRLICRLFLLLGVASTLLFTNFSCTSDHALAYTEPPPPLGPWAADSSYWAWDETEPVLLLGAGVDPLFRSNYISIFKELKKAGGDYVECTLRPDPFGNRQPFPYDSIRGEYDLTRIDSSYWLHVLSIFDAAAKERVVIDYKGLYGQFFPDYSQPDSMAFRTAFARQSFDLLRRQPHVLRTEPHAIVSNQLLVAQPSDWFARRLLTGANAVDFPHPSGQPIDFSRGLSAIRAARRVESLIKFWDLQPAPEILLDGNAPTTTAAKDSLGNYVVHLATPTRVRIRLNTQDQVPIRFTVIGYLGTQRSEVLQPPYGSVFELSTEDERGAWLVMRRLPKGS